MRCPVCGNSAFTEAVSENAIRREIREREEFIAARLGRKGSPEELKDLTDFMHGFAAPLERCAGCGLLARAEARVRTAKSYSKDPNDPGVMDQLFPRYVQAFRNQAPGFRERLRPHAEVLEIGSHLGAFLQVAEEWNWNAVGLDVGCDTAPFARARGLTVKQAMLEDSAFAPGSFDAVFIWNCFEQMNDPAATLRAAHRVLKPHGLLTVRVPNAEFYLKERAATDLAAWNNLPGFPYLYGYSQRLVTRLAGKHGFEFVRGFNSELITMPFADLTSRIAAEQKAASTRAAGYESGPWIETICRRVEQPVPHSRECVDRRFLPRAA
jgi:SAM-dependent methyltransferase